MRYLVPTVAVSALLIVAALSSSAQAAGGTPARATGPTTAGPLCYWSPGWHGGYYLTDEAGLEKSLDDLFHLLDTTPTYKAALELEPYTLERMAIGAQFAVERRGRNKPITLGWSGAGPGKCSVDFTATAAHTGKQGVHLRLVTGDWVNLCQVIAGADLQGVRLRFSAWVRSRGGEARLYIDAHSGADAIPGSGEQTAAAPTDGKWHHVELDYTVPSGTQILFPQAKVTKAPGDADFDDLSLVRADTGQELLQNGGLEATEVPSLKDTSRLDLLKRYIREGRLEVVGGAYTQPIMYTLGQEEVAHQFILGQEAVKRALGAPVTVYEAQEPDWVGQMPQILLAAGIKDAVYRTSWQAFGAAPAHNADLVWWVGPDGSRIEAVPMPAAMRSGWGLTDPFPSIVDKLAAEGLTRPLFSAIGDFSSEYMPAPGSAAAEGWVGGLTNFCRTVATGDSAGKQVELSAWLRTREPGAQLYVDSYKGQSCLGGAQSAGVAFDGKWHKVTLRYQVPAAAERLYPQVRVLISRRSGEVDIAGLKLTVAATGEVLADVGDLGGPDLPHDWGVAGLNGATGKALLATGDAPVGRGYVRLLTGTRLRAAKMVTPTQYLRAMGQPTSEWVDAYADFEHRFPWGLLGGDNLLSDRRTEDLILTLARADALGLLKTRPDLADLWRLLMMGHHHDVWVCAPVPAFGIWHHGYKRQVDVAFACDKEVAQRAAPALRELGPQGPSSAARERTLFALTAGGRHGVTPVRWEAPRGLCRKPVVLDSAGKVVPADLTVAARYADGSAKEVTGSLLADVPALGWRTYRLAEKGDRREPPLKKASAREAGGKAVLDNGLLRVEVGPEGLQVYRGGEALLSSPAHLAGTFADGPKVSYFTAVSAHGEGVDAVAEATGKISAVGLRLRVTLRPYSPAAAIDLQCDFGTGTRVGEGPADMPLMATWSHESRKLRWVFPLRWAKPHFIAHGAYELRVPSQPVWPVVGMALAQGAGGGLALYPDRSTSGIFRANPASLELILAFGGNFIYAPGGVAPLVGRHDYRLAVYPYSGSPEQADVVGHLGEGAGEEGAPAYVWRNGQPSGATARQIVGLSPAAAASVTYCGRDGHDLVLRLWRPYPGDADVTVTVRGAKSLAAADLAGKAEKNLAAGPTAKLRLRSEQVMTIRARGAA